LVVHSLNLFCSAGSLHSPRHRDSLCSSIYIPISPHKIQLSQFNPSNEKKCPLFPKKPSKKYDRRSCLFSFIDRIWIKRMSSPGILFYFFLFTFLFYPINTQRFSLERHSLGGTSAEPRSRREVLEISLEGYATPIFLRV